MKIIDQYLSGEIDAENALIEIKSEISTLQTAFDEISKTYLNSPTNRSNRITISTRATYEFSENKQWTEINSKFKTQLKDIEQKIKFACEKGEYIDAGTGEIFTPVEKKVTEYLIIKKTKNE